MSNLHLDEIQDSKSVESDRISHSNLTDQTNLLRKFVFACIKEKFSGFKSQELDFNRGRDHSSAIDDVQDFVGGADLDSFLLNGCYPNFHGGSIRSRPETPTRPMSFRRRSRSGSFQKITPELDTNEQEVYRKQVARALQGGKNVWL